MPRSVRKRSREEWQGLVRDWRRSGESCRVAAARLGVCASTLAWWGWRLGAAGRDALAGPGFMEVTSAVIPMLDSGAGVAVELGGVRVRLEVGFDDETLSRLLDVLETRQ